MSDALSYRPKAGEIPTEPGVYRFRDPSGRVLYAGGPTTRNAERGALSLAAAYVRPTAAASSVGSW